MARWNKAVGEEISAGDVIAEVETDKAVVDFDATDDAFLAQILVPEGTKDILVGQPVAIFVQDEEDVAAFANFTAGDVGAGASAAAAAPEPAAVEPAAAVPAAAATSWPPHQVQGMPALSPTMEQGNLARWNVKVGDKIEADGVIAEVETDKAVVDFEATDDAYVAALLVAEGEKNIAVGKPVIVLVEEESDVAAFANFTAADAGAEPAAAGAPAPAAALAAAAPAATPAAAPARVPGVVSDISSNIPGAPPTRLTEPASGIRASPRAKAAAGREGLELQTITGSGPLGRIVESDVVAAAAAPRQPVAAATAEVAAPVATTTFGEPATASSLYTDQPVSQIRKIIAARLTESKQTIPHYYLSMDCEVDTLLALRAKINGDAGSQFKLSVNDFIIKASALACKQVPEANSSWQGDTIREYHTVDINVAVATEKGLMTPLVPEADRLGLRSINSEVKDLATAAQSGKLHPDKMRSGTFTISNLGMFGITSFSAVINPPQACILAVGGTQQRVVPDSSSESGFRTANVMSVTLSCDHRVVDGAVGAQWLQHFKAFVEDPTRMLL